MISLGLRLAVTAGKVRLVIIAAAVALGVGLLLCTLAGTNAVQTQNSRYAWLNTGTASTATTDADLLWWLARTDYFHGESIGRVDVAATGARSPVPPGIPRLPGPGEFYASPALTELLRTTPAAELGDRFPGRQIGTIGRSALPAPDSLLIIIGHPPNQPPPDATPVTSISSTDPSECSGCFAGVNADGMALILSVVAAALLFPVLMFIGTATRLAATRREQRFAAMRLVGATPRQISVISAVESTVAAVAGTAAGFGLFLLLRPVLAGVPFTGAPFFASDLSLGPVDVLAVAVGVPAGAVIAARLALRRVQISPLGVSRQVTPRAPQVWRMVPLAVGLGELGYFVGRRPDSTGGQTAAYLSGFLLIMIGLVVAGPWLTMVGARLLARRTGRPAMLIAGRRLSDNPQAGFRAVSGLILALFVTSVATGVITTIAANRGAPPLSSVGGSTLSKMDPDRPVPASLRSVPGVRAVIQVHENPDDSSHMPGLVSCAELAGHPEFGSCPQGTQVVEVYPNPVDAGETWPAATVAADRLSQLPVLTVLVRTDGTTATVERVRTVMQAVFPDGRFPATSGEFEAESTRTLTQWQQLANVVILASLPIAGCSLAVSVAGGLSDRRRPFSMLRLAGVQLGVLRRVVALESAVPLLVVAALATGTGFLAAQLFLTSQMDYSLRPPGIAYYVLVVAGLCIALGIIASTLPLLRRITGPETARNE